MENSKTIFVTGATGFIGERLCLKLASENHLVKALVRNPDKSPLLKENANITLVKGDLGDYESLVAASSGCEYAYHIAGFVEPWHRDESMFYKINVDGTRNVLDACISNGLEKLVFTSTAGVFGPSGGSKVTEKTERVLPLTTHYEKSKEQAEKLVREYHDKGLEVVIVNPTRVFGEGLLSKSNAATQLIDRYSRGKWRILPGTGKKLGNYVHVDDVVEGHTRAMEFGRSGENYLLGGDSVSYSGFFDTIADHSGQKHWMIPLSNRIIIAISYVELWKANIFKIPPLITPGFAKKYLYDWDNDSSKAIEELGYSPRSLSEGVKLTLNWLKDKSGN